jgi:hypothetical protein
MSSPSPTPRLTCSAPPLASAAVSDPLQALPVQHHPVTAPWPTRAGATLDILHSTSNASRALFSKELAQHSKVLDGARWTRWSSTFLPPTAVLNILATLRLRRHTHHSSPGTTTCQLLPPATITTIPRWRWRRKQCLPLVVMGKSTPDAPPYLCPFHTWQADQTADRTARRPSQQNARSITVAKCLPEARTSIVT